MRAFLLSKFLISSAWDPLARLTGQIIFAPKLSVGQALDKDPKIRRSVLTAPSGPLLAAMPTLE